MPTDDLHTTGSLATKLGVHRTTVNYWVQTGKLVPTQVVNGIRLFDEAEVERFLAERANPVDEAEVAG